MKSAPLPSLRVEPEFRAEVDAVLGEGETLSEFVARGLQARDEARRSGDHVDAEPVADGLQRRLDAIRAGLATLRSSPLTCRKAGTSPFLRELVIPFGHLGDVALFEIEGALSPLGRSGGADHCAR